MQTTPKNIGDFSPAEIREQVRSKYSEVALNPTLTYKFRVGCEYALDLGYPRELIHSLTAKMADTFTGVSSFLSHFQDCAKGGVVLELGSGGGLDTVLLAKKFGGSTKIIGVDLSLNMVQRATRSVSELELEHVHYARALAEELPVRENSVDWVFSNGILNLSPEKERILNEIHRVLKPEGHVLCSEIVLYQEPSPEERLNVDDWFK